MSKLEKVYAILNIAEEYMYNFVGDYDGINNSTIGISKNSIDHIKKCE